MKQLVTHRNVPLHFRRHPDRDGKDRERNLRTTGVESDGNQHVQVSAEARDSVLRRVCSCEACRAMATAPTGKQVSSDQRRGFASWRLCRVQLRRRALHLQTHRFDRRSKLQ
ncbi:hypothetical protein [Arabidopsis thaliana]|uniref:At4g32080 n=1 Tax=Arabidopsis thaliana TaxID=3702 RepID=O49384_ARATH|nr:uncharacterized protein AT4G32080 [Arabidopsis thaliana]AAT85733.1 At4g32080 [Arabidopsis thaliana]AAU15145.1 At4g32080 [Arabidopsis thaliana]AAU44529.1 hypothetical protein AT4G32080 [Arabidopsis thaliana]AAV63921.1 hypothetical protein At4g32080 [Arabidopsis thaliana]AEE86002.1 hypothetical protein AT4G32080 [Arabidopsis thaliana]|eukprot:NP_194936.1 hypothetical protein AT4G32080 [Arabidopsis thaliana]